MASNRRFRIKLVLTLALLLWTTPSFAQTWNRVGSPSKGLCGSASCSRPFTPTTGNLIVVYAYGYDGITTPTDDGTAGGSTYSQAFKEANHDFPQGILAVYYAKAVASVANVTFTCTTSCDGVIIQEYSGQATSSPLDVASTQAFGMGTTATSNAVSPTGTDLEVGLFYNEAGTGVFTAVAPFSTLTNQTTADGGGLGFTDQLGANTATASATASSTTWAAWIVTFKPNIPACSGPSKLLYQTQPSTAQIGASLGTVHVEVVDSSNVLCASDTSTITLSSHSGSTASTLQSSSSLSKAAVAGIATWTDLFVSPTGGVISIDASDGVLTGATSNATNIGPSTQTAATCGQADVDAVVNGPTHTAIDGDTIRIPAGTCTWANGVIIPTGIGISIIGAGTADAHNPSGSGVTTIIDNCSSGACTSGYLFSFTPVYGASLSRLSSFNLSPEMSLGASSLSPALAFNGTCTSSGCPNMRVDHIVFPASPSWGLVITPSATIMIEDNMFGVIDHNSAYHASGGTYEIINYNHSAWKGVGHYGDNSWNQAATLGTSQALYVEANYLETTDGSAFGVVLTESEAGFNAQVGEGGGRVVCRFNTFVGSRLGCSNHGEDSNGRPESPRQMEFYKNTLTCTSGDGTACGSMGFTAGATVRGGTIYSFANTFNGGVLTLGTGAYDSLNLFRTTTGYTPWNVCDGAGPYDYNDGMTYATGTITSAVLSAGKWTITDSAKTGGSAWTINQWGVYPNSGSPPGAFTTTVYSLHDVTTGDGSWIVSNGTNTLVVQGPAQGSASWTMGDSYQIRRAIGCGGGVYWGGSLLSGATPSPTNADGGWVNPTSIDGMYQAANTITSGFPGYPPIAVPVHFVVDREYHAQVSQTAQSNSTTPFDGTTGTGFGVLSNRPTTCTTGVGYWATDQGSWNTSGSGGNGVLYICTSTNTWTLSYTPYTYPHPLDVAPGSPRRGLTLLGVANE